MASLNKVFLIGNLGRDPEMRATQSGMSVANFTMATTEKWKDKAGQLQEKTEWHRIVVWGAQASFCERYLKKGRQVFVEGTLQTREWNDRDGNKRQTTEVKALRIQPLDRAQGAGARPEAGVAVAEDTDPEYHDDNDNIPF